MARKDLRKFIKKECIEHEDALSVVAIDTNGNDKVVGAVLGYSVSKGKKVPYMHSAWMRPLYPVLPRKMVVGNTMGWYYENQHRAHPLQALEELKVDKMCQGEILVASKHKRGFGLGRELFRQSMELAKLRGCQAYFSVVSGIYSQKIASDLEMEVLREYDYDSMTDYRGKTILNDTLEHTKLQIVTARF